MVCGLAFAKILDFHPEFPYISRLECAMDLRSVIFVEN
jgi:hypothetical protein